MTLAITRKLSAPEKCGVWKDTDGRGQELAIAWVKGPGMAYQQPFRYPEEFADAMIWLAEQAPGIEPRIASSLQRKET